MDVETRPDTSVRITGRNRYADEPCTVITVRDDYGVKFLVIEGGYIENRGKAGGFVLAAKHPSATDQEGDSSYVVLIEGCGLVWTDMFRSQHTFTAALLNAGWFTDAEAAAYVEENGYLQFTPPKKPWKPGAYIIEVEHTGSGKV